MNDIMENNVEERVALTDWANPPKLANLKQDLMDAQSTHDAQKTQIGLWLDNLHVRNKAKPKANKGSSQIQPKLIRKQAEWRYSALTEPFLSTDDLFNVSPVTWEDKQAATQNQLVLNHQFNNKIPKVTFIDEFVRTAVDEGTVILRTGWDFHEEIVKESKPTVQYIENPAFTPMHQELQKLFAASPSQFQTDVPEELKIAHQMTMERGVAIEPRVTGHEMVDVRKTVRNCPTVEVCDYRNVIIDPSCNGDLKKARFIIYSWETSKSELKKDGKYKNLDHILMDSNSILSTPDHVTQNTSNFNFSDEPRKKFVIFEYWGFWDIKGDGTVEPIVAAWVGNELVRMEENPYPDKELPFVISHYLPVRKSLYGEPDGALLEDNQKIIGAITRGMIDVMGKSANGQTGMSKAMLDATNRKKFENGQDYEFNPGTDPRLGVHMHTYPEIPRSAEFMIESQNMEAESLTGVKSFSSGVSGASLGNVAAGVRGALDASSKRELGILRRLSNAMCEVGRKFISMNSEFLDEEEVIRITNEEFVTVRRDDLSGSFDLKLSISTAEEDNNKAEQLAFMLQTMGPNEDPGMRKIILSDICRLRKMPDLAEKIENYEPQPDPMQVKMQELQIALLEAQVANEQAKSLVGQSTAQLNAAKTQTEGVKAGNLQSDTDQKNLDFVEQESGVKQERDIQKVGEQARSQAQLKVLDHQFKREEMHHDLLKEYIAAKKG